MGGAPKPDTSALRRQEEQARAEAERLAKQRQDETLALRRKNLGRQSLIRNLGGETGGLGSNK